MENRMASHEPIIKAARRVEEALQWFVKESYGEEPYELFFYDAHRLNEPIARLASLHPEGELPVCGRWLWNKFLIARADTTSDFRTQQRAVFDAHKDFRKWLVEYYRLADTPYLAETLSDPEKRVLEQVTSKPRKSEAIARSVGKAAGTVRKILVRLTERGLIDNIGSGYFRA
jgi:hypothetical protein